MPRAVLASIWIRRALAFGRMALAAGLASSPAAAAVVDAKRVVDTDTAVPGGPFEPGSSTTFTTLFSGPVAADRLVFAGWVQDEIGILDGEGIYSVDVGGGEAEVIVDTRTCAVDCPSETNVFTAFGGSYSFDGTTVGFVGDWDSAVTFDDQGVWTAQGAGLTLVARDGDPNPSGGTFSIFGSPAVDANEVAFTERSALSERGIFAAPSGGGDPRTVVDGSTAAPGGGGALIDPFSLTTVGYRDGLLVFRAELDDDTEGLYVEDEIGLRAVVDSATPAPGLDGETFERIFNFATDDGDIVFLGGAPSILSGRGLYVERDGALLPAPILIARAIGGTLDPCDQSTPLTSILGLAVGDGAVALVAEGALYTARIGTEGLSRLLVTGDTVDGKTVDFIGAGVLHREAIADGAVYPLLSFTDGSKGIYCLGIPTTPQCSPAPVPVQCVPEPGAAAPALAALAGLILLRRRGSHRKGLRSEKLL